MRFCIQNLRLVLTLQLDEIGRERQVQRQGAQRAEARAELSVELAQARILPAYELGPAERACK